MAAMLVADLCAVARRRRGITVRDRGAHAPDPSRPSASSDSVSLGSPHGTPLRREALVDALDGEHDPICGIGPIAFPIRRCHTSIGYLV
jgi:hypothetical protein